MGDRGSRGMGAVKLVVYFWSSASVCCLIPEGSPGDAIVVSVNLSQACQ